jgi:DNA-binding MarR family transcriptional regulator
MNQPPPTLAQVLRAAHALEARLEADLAAAGISIAKLGVLRALAEANEPLTLGGVAEQVSCVRSNITQLVDRLEAEGLVRRVADSVDRRSKRAELTPAGRRSYADSAEILRRHEAAVAEALGDETATFLAALGRLAP